MAYFSDEDKDGVGGTHCNRICDAYRKRSRHKAIMGHIKGCFYCRFMLFENDPYLSRRKWLRITAASLVAIAVVGAGWTAWRRIQAQPESLGGIQAKVGLDAVYASGGVAAITGLLSPSTGTTQDAQAVLDWIVMRGHVGLYNLMVTAIGDVRLPVRISAVGGAAAVAPLDLKPYQALLNGFSSTEPDIKLRKRIRSLALEVRAA